MRTLLRLFLVLVLAVVVVLVCGSTISLALMATNSPPPEKYNPYKKGMDCQIVTGIHFEVDRTRIRTNSGIFMYDQSGAVNRTAESPQNFEWRNNVTISNTYYIFVEDQMKVWFVVKRDGKEDFWQLLFFCDSESQ